MATVNSRELVEEIIANHGEYHGDPPVFMIIEYQNDFNGETCWSLCYRPDDVLAAYNSPFVHKPRIIFTQSGGDWREL